MYRKTPFCGVKGAMARRIDGDIGTHVLVDPIFLAFADDMPQLGDEFDSCLAIEMGFGEVALA